MTEYYPELIGLSSESTMTPNFDSQNLPHMSGQETPVGYWEFPQWLIEIQYEYLPNKTGKKDLETLVGFFLKMRGSFGRFYFRHPDLNFVPEVTIGVGNGVDTEFTLIRDIGGFVEPIGTIKTETAQITVDGVPKSEGSDYTVEGNKLTFAVAPAIGKVVTGSYEYFFMCRFEDSSADFDRFSQELWELNQLSLRSIIQ